MTSFLDKNHQPLAVGQRVRGAVRFNNQRVADPVEGVLNIGPRIPPARRADASHPPCASTAAGGGQADGLA